MMTCSEMTDIVEAMEEERTRREHDVRNEVRKVSATRDHVAVLGCHCRASRAGSSKKNLCDCHTRT